LAACQLPFGTTFLRALLCLLKFRSFVFSSIYDKLVTIYFKHISILASEKVIWNFTPVEVFEIDKWGFFD
jgi:hypothetical protein